MNVFKSLILIIFVSFSVQAKTVSEKFERNNFDEAKKSTPYLKFTGTSTKFGFVSTDFDGYAKNFELSYDFDQKAQTLQSISLTILTISLDTDNSSRNEKLHTKCLAENESKKIIAEAIAPIKLQIGEKQETSIKMIANKKEILIPLTYSVIKTNEGFQIILNGHFSFKEAGITDPSIAIAKLEEKIRIEGVINLK